eukprot:Gb_40919 [translate_table: standard]
MEILLMHILRRRASGAFGKADGRHRRQRKRADVGEPMTDIVGSLDTDIIGKPRADIVGEHRQVVEGGIDTDRLGRSHRQRKLSSDSKAHCRESRADRQGRACCFHGATEQCTGTGSERGRAFNASAVAEVIGTKPFRWKERETLGAEALARWEEGYK